jgi:hypothetical protein
MEKIDMKIENVQYVIMKIGNIEFNGETAYLAPDYNFTNDIKQATKAANRRTALELKHSYEVEKNHNYESDLKIVPLKITYEW